MRKTKEIVVVEKNAKVVKDMSLEDCTSLFEGAVKKWANEVYVAVKGTTNNLMEYDDFYSEGMICLIEMFDRYAPINTFNTALHKSLDNLKIDFIRMANAKKRKTKNSVVSLDLELEDIECDSLSEILGTEDESFEEIEFNSDIKGAIENLNDEEIKILIFLLNNESTKRKLARELNISRPTLDTRIEVLKDKVIDLLPEYIKY